MFSMGLRPDNRYGDGRSVMFAGISSLSMVLPPVLFGNLSPPDGGMTITRVAA
jgi:hypothetical protein